MFSEKNEKKSASQLKKHVSECSDCAWAAVVVVVQERKKKKWMFLSSRQK
jgi:hypothetical protein